MVVCPVGVHGGHVPDLAEVELKQEPNHATTHHHNMAELRVPELLQIPYLVIHTTALVSVKYYSCSGTSSNSISYITHDNPGKCRV